MNCKHVTDNGIQTLSAEELGLVSGGSGWGEVDGSTYYDDGWLTSILDWYFGSYSGTGTLVFVEHTGYDDWGNAYTYVQPTIFEDSYAGQQNAIQVEAETQHETSYSTYSGGYDPNYYNGDNWMYDGGGGYGGGGGGGDGGGYYYEDRIHHAY